VDDSDSGIFLPNDSPTGLRAADDIRNLALNRAAYASSSADFINTGHMATDGQMATKWQSKAGKPQWIYVDLGADCTIGKVVLRWDGAYAKAYKIQVSTDAGPSPATGLVEHWTDVFTATDRNGGVEEIPLPPVKARYVRLRCDEQGLPRSVSLAEFEVYGNGGPTMKPNLVPPPKDGIWDLYAGWKLSSQSFVADDAAKVSTSGYDDGKWLAATVPGTVLTAYQNLGRFPTCSTATSSCKFRIGSAGAVGGTGSRWLFRRATAENECG